MKMNSRFLSILLGLVEMALGLIQGMSLTAYAEEKTISEGVYYQIGDTIKFTSSGSKYFYTNPDGPQKYDTSLSTATLTYSGKDSETGEHNFLIGDISCRGPFNDIHPTMWGIKITSGDGFQSNAYIFIMLYEDPKINGTGVSLKESTTLNFT